ncbi:MAG: T9SS type A sorting domain-containing protein [Bacteroidota bacterium]
MRALVFLLALAPLAVSAQVEITDATCATNGDYFDPLPAEETIPNGRIAWPADDPLWEFDVYRPDNRTTVNSGGVEIRNVYYRGRKVFDRASVPVVNVEYDEGGCGCFRDWQTQSAPIEISPDAVLAVDCGLADGDRTGISVSAPGTVRTACEANAGVPASVANAGDVGDFRGLAVEDYGDELVVTGHSRAGWYRYRMKWHFYADGRIWPEYSFTAARSVCTENGRRHHAYWRFDFDLEATPTDDVIRQHAGSAVSVVDRESSFALSGPSDDTFWSVTDAATGFGYEIIPGDEDKRLSVDAFSKVDALALVYKMDEIDDGITIGGGCAFEYEPFLDGEALVDADAVFWYRAGTLREAGQAYDCDIVGPMLRPIGLPPVSTGPGVENAEIEAARPNPFSGVTEARFRVERAQTVSVEVYDLTGRRVQVAFEGAVAAGTWQSVRVDARELPAGTYILRVRGETARGSTRLVLIR